MAKSSRSTKHTERKPELVKPRSRQMAKVASVRWDGIRQTEQDIREFFENRDLGTCMDTFAAMRKQYEIAGKIIDVRVQEKNVEACIICGKVFGKDNPWFNRDPVKDLATGIVRNVFTCCQAHLIESKSRQSQKHF